MLAEDSSLPAPTGDTSSLNDLELNLVDLVESLSKLELTLDEKCDLALFELFYQSCGDLKFLSSYSGSLSCNRPAPPLSKLAGRVDF